MINIFKKQPTMEGKANQALTYEEFDPFCKWQRVENEDVIEIHLPDFKQEHLKLTSNSAILKISGERPLNASRKIKFYKQIQISSNYDASAIHAVLENGKLYITMPKGKTSVRQNPNPKPIEDQSIAPPPSGGTDKDQIQTPYGISSVMCEFQRLRSAAPSFRLLKVAVTLVTLVAYVVCVHKSTVAVK